MCPWKIENFEFTSKFANIASTSWTMNEVKSPAILVIPRFFKRIWQESVLSLNSNGHLSLKPKSVDELEIFLHKKQKKRDYHGFETGHDPIVNKIKRQIMKIITKTVAHLYYLNSSILKYISCHCESVSMWDWLMAVLNVLLDRYK